MKEVTLILDAASPVAFRAGRDEESAQSLDYLPGTTLRGALASAHARLRPDQTDEFRELFLEGKVHYGDGLPVGTDREEVEVRSHAPWIRPLPRTAYTCKRCPGFAPVRLEPGRERHGVRDGAIDLALFAMSGRLRLDLLSDLEACGHRDSAQDPCPAPLERFSGFYLRDPRSRLLDRTKADPEVRTRTGSSRYRGTVHTSILYSRGMLGRGTAFLIRLAGESDSLATIREFLDQASAEGLLRVGNNRTRGLGGLRLAPGSWCEAPEGLAPLQGRLGAFEAAFRKRAAEREVSLAHATYLPITLHSDVIRLDELLRCRGRLDGVWLSGETGIQGAHLVFHVAASTRIAGWNALWGLPRSDIWPISRGSFFLLGLDHKLTDQDLGDLERLEQGSTGLRRTEGFGRIVIADAFHLEVNQR